MAAPTSSIREQASARSSSSSSSSSMPAPAPAPAASTAGAQPPVSNPYHKHIQHCPHPHPHPAAPAMAPQDPAAPPPPVPPAASAPSQRPAPTYEAPTAPALSAPPALVYLASYSGVPVYEILVRNTSVMRRRADGFLNATQILKAAGIEKSRRTKILEKEIQNGEHDKVQGGYGKYQGTWIPLARAQELSAIHGVAHILKPLLLLDPEQEASIPNAAPRKRPNPNAPQQSLGRAAANATAPIGDRTGAFSGSVPGYGTSTPAWDSNQGGPDGSRGSAPTHQPRFLALSGGAPVALGGNFLNAPDSDLEISAGQGAAQAALAPTPSGQPPTSQPGQGAAAEDVFGPLEPATAASNRPGGKRPSATGDDDGDNGEPAAKKARAVDGTAPRAGLYLGDSLVTDLNALHPSAGLLQPSSPGRDSTRRGTAAAAAVAAANIRASAWQSTATASSTHASHATPSRSGLRSTPRYADRPRLPRASDEAERRARELLIHLFVDDGSSGGPRSLLAGWSLHDTSAEDGKQGNEDGSREAAVKTPAEIAAAARAPFVFGAAAVGAVRANSGSKSGEGAGGPLPPETAQRKLDELLALLARAVGLDGFEEALANAAASSSAVADVVRRRGIDLDIVTDDHGHTVLHWAAALGRIELVSVLVARPPALGGRGADDASSTSDKGKQRADVQVPAQHNGVVLGGANPNAGNHAGETALQRTVLVVNAWEHGYFPQLLRLLAPSLMTRDFRGRTVLHHIALVSGLRGRAASARYYLECILEFAREVYGSTGPEAAIDGEAQEAGGASAGAGRGTGAPIGLGLGLGMGGGHISGTPTRKTSTAVPTSSTGTAPTAAVQGQATSTLLPTYVLENLIDAQDEDGETALGIVARLGNASLVKLLLDAGARKDLPNLLGIRPSDWGLEMAGLSANGEAGAGGADAGGHAEADAARVAVGTELAATRPQDIVAAFGHHVKRTPMKSSEILESISHSLDELTSTYTTELSEKKAALEAVQGLLKPATRELANRRREVSLAQNKADAREETLQRLNNLLEVLASLKAGSDEGTDAHQHWWSSFRVTESDADGDVSMDKLDPTHPDSILAPFPTEAQAKALPRADKIEALLRGRFLLSLLARECTTLQNAMDEMDTTRRTKEAQYRKLVSLCSGVPERNVVEMLDELVLAIESDGADVDLDRLAGFLDKIQPSRGAAVAGAGGGASTAIAPAPGAAVDANGS